MHSHAFLKYRTDVKSAPTHTSQYRQRKVIYFTSNIPYFNTKARIMRGEDFELVQEESTITKINV